MVLKRREHGASRLENEYSGTRSVFDFGFAFNRNTFPVTE